MRDLFRNPFFYYLAIPAVVGLWPLLLWGRYLPQAHRDVNKWKQDFSKAQPAMVEILKADPDRVDSGPRDGEKFDWTSAINRASQQCGIPSVTHQTGMLQGDANKQKQQTAVMSLKDVSIVQFANFLWSLQRKWPNLECTYIKLTAKKDGKKETKDKWDVSLNFRYFFE